MEEAVEEVRKPRTIIIEIDTIGSLFRGLLFGGLVGATIALLVTPQSGVKNRLLLNEKSSELKTRAQEVANEARIRARRVVASARGIDAPNGSGNASQQLREESRVAETGGQNMYDL